jgi:ABC-type oligopeptide transport system substrate-binding subunit/class 3 adenylate cyclase
MTDARDERRIVTALFADVVGSTPVAEALGAEEAKLVIGEAIGRAIRAVEAYGGSVNNLLGDGLLALFGAPIAHEDDPERAVRAALDIIGSARDYGEQVRRGWGVSDFAMRIGIHTGDVVVGLVGAGSAVEYGVVGDTINTTARLQAAAPRNGIVVSEATQRQVAHEFRWSEPRRLELKGKAQAVTAFELLGPSQTHEAEAVSGPLLGRDAELRTVSDLVDRLASGGGAVLFIVGEPGIGKSRLAAELRRQATEAGTYAWLEGRCVSYGEALPYWPYRDLLRNWLGVGPTEPELRVRVKLRKMTDEAFPGRGAQAYPYLATVLGVTLEPDAAEQLKKLSPESLQYRTFEVFSEMLEGIATERPVVIALDDLHWADATSLALTERLLGLVETAPVMLAVSQRPETDHPSWRLKEKAAREYRHLFRELHLQPLTTDSESALLRSLAGNRHLPQSVVDQLLAYAEGNPFYLEQLLRSLIDSGVLVPENGHWNVVGGSTMQLPQSLEAVIIARIDRLEPDWRDVLTSAAVLGRTFSIELVQAVTALDLPRVRAAIHHLLRLDMLREEAGGGRSVYRYKHALIQEAAYKTLVATKRAALHRRAAEWYETYYHDRLERVYGLLAHHWLGSDDREKAAEYLKLAGDGALAEWSLDEAAEHFRSLVPLLEAADRRQEAAETLFQLATALHLGMRYREANETWQRAFAQWQPVTQPDPVANAGLRIAPGLVPWALDPLNALYTSNVRLHQQLYDRLVDVRQGVYVIPALADRWEVSDDGRTYRVHLREGASRSDGTPVTAEDVVNTLKALMTPANEFLARANTLMLENADRYVEGQMEDFSEVGARALDRQTVEFRLREQAPYLLHLFGWPAYAASSKQASSGPFLLRQATPQHVVIERDPSFKRWRGGNVGAVEFVESGPDAIKAMYEGRLDLLNWLPGAAAQAAFSDPRFKVATPPTTRSTFLAFTGETMMRDLPFRRAIAYATDRQRLKPHVLQTDVLASGGFPPPGIIGHTPDIALPFDPDRARTELAKSSDRGPLVVSFYGVGMAEFWSPLVMGWREILGVEVQLVQASTSEHERAPEWAHAMIGHWVAAYPDPEYYLRGVFFSKSSSNLGHWTSEELDALIEQAVRETNGPTRLGLFHQADKRLVQEECALVPILYGGAAFLLQPWVRGWFEWGVPWQSFDELVVDERSPRAYGLD